MRYWDDRDVLRRPFRVIRVEDVESAIKSRRTWPCKNATRSVSRSRNRHYGKLVMQLAFPRASVSDLLAGKVAVYRRANVDPSRGGTSASLPRSCRKYCTAVHGGKGRVEGGRGGLGPVASAPFPTPAHQTERADFRHSAFRLASPQGPLWSAARCWCPAITPRHVTYLRLAI
jgi:hypothetical protein